MTVRDKYLKLALWTIFFSFLGALIVAQIIARSGGMTGKSFIWMLYLYMITPTIASIFTRLIFKIPLNWGLLKFGETINYIWAWIIPILLIISSIVLTYIFRQNCPGLAKLPVLDFSSNLGNSPLTIALSHFIINITIGLVINFPATLGEEYGWRGTIFASIMKSGINLKWAIVISGALWGLWYAPLILMGLNFPNHPILGLFVYLIFSISVGGIYVWIYLKSQSIFASAIAHGVLNGSAQAVMIIMTPKNELVGGSVGLIAFTIASAIMLILWIKFPPRIPEDILPICNQIEQNNAIS